LKHEKANQPQRRVKIPGRTVYQKLNRDGTPERGVFEFDYQDALGKRRWATVRGTVKDAEAAREDMRSRSRRGEHVGPSKLTFAEVVAEWETVAKPRLRPRTWEKYEANLRLHLSPRFGRSKITNVRVDEVAALVAAMQADGFAAWTTQGVLVTLGRVMGFAARRGYITANPVARLERSERPKPVNREHRILSAAQLRALIEATTPTYQPLIATAAMSGMRLSELLGLTWADVDLAGGLLHVRKTLARKGGGRVAPKTPHAVRAIVMAPALARVLRDHKARAFALGRTRPECLVFLSAAGTPLGHRNVERRGLDAAAEKCGLNEGDLPKLWLHDLRSTFASMLIAAGADVVFVSRQLGHASPEITLRVYAHLFDRAEHAEAVRAMLDASFGG
jgi:integrase